MESKKTVKHTVRIPHNLIEDARKILKLENVKLPYNVIVELALRKFVEENKMRPLEEEDV